MRDPYFCHTLWLRLQLVRFIHIHLLRTRESFWNSEVLTLHRAVCFMCVFLCGVPLWASLWTVNLEVRCI